MQEAGLSTMAWLVVLAVILDFSSTLVGLKLGLAERGLVAGRLLPVLGVAYFVFEFTVLYSLYYVLGKTGLSREWAAAIVAVGPWLAGWSNIGLILRVAG